MFKIEEWDGKHELCSDSSLWAGSRFGHTRKCQTEAKRMSQRAPSLVPCVLCSVEPGTYCELRRHSSPDFAWTMGQERTHRDKVWAPRLVHRASLLARVTQTWTCSHSILTEIQDRTLRILKHTMPPVWHCLVFCHIHLIARLISPLEVFLLVFIHSLQFKVEQFCSGLCSNMRKELMFINP